MNVRFRHIFLAITVLLSMLGIGFTSSASAISQLPAPQLQGDDSGLISSMDAPTLQAGVKNRDWTREEMMNAIPYPLELSGNGKPTILSDQDLQLTGEPVFIEGMLPLNERADSMIIPTFSLGGVGSLEPSGYSYPAPFTRYQNFNKYKNYPYITIGKLFFTRYGSNYVCSAASIGNFAIWTAGHCVHAGDGISSSWSYNVVFVPGYENGKAPKGQWKYYSLWTSNDWYYNHDPRYDIGGALLKKKDGYKISQKVGNLGFAYNSGLNRHWHVIGYPAVAPFNGLTQQICTASYAYSDTDFGSPYPSAIGCDLTGGASGGPWITNFGGTGYGNYLNGNSSYRHAANIYEMYTPYFGDLAYSLYYQLVTSVVP